MQEENNLPKYNLKSWLKSSILGFFIGIGVIVPGVSGAQISIIFKLYDKLTYAISNIFKKFITCLLFLLPIIIGIIVGFVLGFFAVDQLLQLSTIVLVALFAGMMSAGTYSIIGELKTEKFKIKKIIWVLLGFLIPLGLSLVSIYTQFSLESQFQATDWWFYITLFFIGILVGFTQIIPGLSATSLLMSFGLYKPLINSVSLSALSNNPMIFLFYLILVVGFVVGVFSISKLVTYLIAHFKNSFYYFVLGLSISSIVVMFYNPEILQAYEEFSNYIGDTKYYVELILSPILFVIGFILIFLLIIKSENREENK